MKEQLWKTPSFTVLRMDAEVGSYQDEFDPTREAPAFMEAATALVPASGLGAPDGS